MFGERLIDLDELILRCRGEQARLYIADAVACYRAGAFRPCIVATWVSVVFDFIHKLDELALTGDRDAAVKRAEYEDIRRTEDIRRSLKFEEELLDLAKDKFELISPVEYLDLKRLKDDRNRCAHPSMTAYDEVYQPSAELARYHIRNVVTYLLQHPPVQGKAALERLTQEVTSPYFPTRHEDVLVQLRSGPLARPRAALVRNFAQFLLKTLLQDDLDFPSVQRHVAALRAVQTLHHTIVEQLFAQRLSDLMRRLDTPGRAVRLLELLPEARIFLQADVVTRLALYVEQADPIAKPRAFLFALDFSPLQAAALARLDNLPVETMKLLIAHKPRSEFIDRALTLYKEAGDFYSANDLAATLILPLVSLMGFAHIERVLQIAATNSQVLDSNQFPTVLQALRTNGRIPEADFQNALIRFAADYPYKDRALVALFDEQPFRQLLEALFEKEDQATLYFVPKWLNEAKRTRLLSHPVVDELLDHYETRYAHVLAESEDMGEA